MIDTQPCAALLASDLAQLYAFVKSQSGQVFLFGLATARTLALYFGRSRYPEAQELASAILIGCLLAILIAAQAAQVPAMVRQIIACKNQEMPTRVAKRKAPHTPRED